MKRLNELFQVFIGLCLFASLECGRRDHVHLKIHVPDIIHKHQHVKTKLVHVFHPKVVHSDHHYLHARNDPNIGLINGGYPQSIITLNRHQPEYRITEDEFLKWRQEQQRKSLEKRKHQFQNHDNEEEAEDEYDERQEENEENNSEYEEDLYQRHKANKLNSNKKDSKFRNHNYSQDYDATNADKVYAHHPDKKSKRPPKNDNYDKHKVYGVSNVDADSVIQPALVDPGYYSTLPKNLKQISSNHDDIYSGLLSRKYNRNIADKSKLLADINYNRKQQTKNLIQRRRGQ